MTVLPGIDECLQLDELLSRRSDSLVALTLELRRLELEEISSPTLEIEIVVR